MTQEIQSVCTYCGTGCDIVATVENNTVLKIDANPNGTVSRGKLCIKGKSGYEFLFSPNRINGARVSKKFIEANRSNLPEHLLNKLFLLHEIDVDFYACDYDIAFDLASWKLGEVIEKYGADVVGCVGGARTSCENDYFFQKFAREIIGTAHVDNCGRVCHAPSLAGLKRTVGEGASSVPFDDIFEAEFLFIIGSNTTEAHPIVAHRVIEAKQKGVKVAVMDVRKTTIFKSADLEVVIPFETNLLILNLIAKEIIRSNRVDRAFVESRTKNYEEYLDLITKDTNESDLLKDYEGLDLIIKQLADLITTKKTIFMWGLGVSEHIDGSDTVSAIANLALLTGNVGKVGAGLMPLRGQNNVQGACDMGCLPYYLAGYRIPEVIGLMTPDMVDAMLEGKMKALFNMGEDLMHVHANLHKLSRGLDNLELLCVNELFPNEITKKADIVFGVKSAYEKEGIYINAERRMHLSKPLMESNLPDDWEIYAEIAKRLGKEVNYKNHREIWEDLRKETPNHFVGASYELLERNLAEGVQWPALNGVSGTERLHMERFATEDGLARFVFKPWIKRGMLLDRKGFWLTTGRTLVHYNNAAQTKEVDKLNRKYEEDVILVSPEDGAKLDLEKRYKMRSIYGETRGLKIKIDKGIQKGTLYCTFHHARSHINYIFGDEADSITKTPRFKALKVELTEASE